MTGLWVKFPDEALSACNFTAQQRRALEDIFSAEKGSAWQDALALIGLRGTGAPLVRWHGNAPYFNASAMTGLISGGAVEIVRTGSGYGQRMRFGPLRLWRLIRTQWKIARFVQDPQEAAPLPLSIALGIAMQALLMRLGKDAPQLPAWLSGAQAPPGKHAKTVAQLQALQVRRTALSPAWRALFPSGGGAEDENLPDYFWDGETPQAPPPAPQSESGEWRGLPVCAGRVNGIAVMAESDFEALRQEYQAPVILVFKSARPETTELFSRADAALFGRGGVMSHACTVARERNLPAVTDLGMDFFDSVARAQRAGKPLWLGVDAGSGVVRILGNPKPVDTAETAAG